MSLRSSTIIGGSGAEKRRDLDFYPTPKECTHALIKHIEFWLRSPNMQLATIWEPACGTGEMSEVLKEYGYQVISSDIRFTGYGVGGSDYLTANRPQNYDAIITNPPFNLAEKFIIRAVNEADVVAMLLKSQYWHAKKRYELFKAYPPAFVLPLTWRPDFTKGGEGSPTMDMIWTVWIKDFNNKTEYIPLLKPQSNERKKI